MKLKLYLRGIGVGLLVGALALLIFGGVDAGKSSDSASDGSVSVLITPVENTDENKENEGALYATAYPLEATADTKEDSEVSEESKEADTTIDEELTSTSDSISEKSDKTQEAISQALSKSSDAQKTSGQGSSVSGTQSSKVEIEDGEAYAVNDDTDTSASSSAKASTVANSSSTSKNTTTSTDNTSKADNQDTSGLQASSTSDTLSSTDPNTDNTTNTSASTSGKSVLVTIPGGSDSASVCKVLQKAGAIDDAASFDAYLVSRGLDRYIRSGTYYITEGSSYEAIAKLITGK